MSSEPLSVLAFNLKRTNARLAPMAMSNWEEPCAGTTKARSTTPLATCSPRTFNSACRPVTGSARSLGLWTVNLTKKFCCSKLPPTNSMPATVRMGLSKCGATREHAAVHAVKSDSNNHLGLRGTIQQWYQQYHSGGP